MLQKTPEADLPPSSSWLERAMKIVAVAIFIGMVATFVVSFLR